MTPNWELESCGYFDSNMFGKLLRVVYRCKETGVLVIVITDKEGEYLESSHQIE